MGVRQRAQAAREARVLAAARVLFTERGFEQTSVRDIAERAGVSVGTVANTGDKATLLRSIFDESETMALLGRFAALDARPPVAFAEELMDVFDEWFASVAADAELVRDYCLTLLVQGGEPLRAGLDESIRRAIARRLVVHHPRLDEQAAADLALAIYATMCMVVVGIVLGSIPRDEGRERAGQVVRTLVSTL